METETALVGTNGAVHLYAVTAVDMNLTLVILPGHTENNDALSFYHALQNLCFFILWILFQHGHYGGQNLFNGVLELNLLRVALLNDIQYILNVLLHICH